MTAVTTVAGPDQAGRDQSGPDQVVPVRGASAARAASVFVGRSIRHSRRDVEALTMAVALPVMLMVLFTFVFGGAINPTGGSSGYLTYVVPGIVLLCAGFGSASTAVSVSQDMTTGLMTRLRTLPIARATVLVGHVVASLARNIVATAVVIGVGVVLGFRPHASAAGWLVAAGLIVAWILAITSLFAAVGLVAGSAEAAAGYGFALLFLPYASSAFVPVSTMPSWLQGFAAHQPVTPLVEAIRAALAGHIGAGETLISLAWCAGIVVVSGAVIARVFPRGAVR